MKKATIATGGFRAGLCLLVLLLLAPAGSAQNLGGGETFQRGQAAGIEPALLESLRERATSRGLGDEEFASLLDPAISLAEQNLPSEMVLLKAMEGLAKGVPAQQMNAVLQNIRSNTEAVVPLIDSWVGSEGVQQMLAGPGGRFSREQFRNEAVRVSARAVSEQAGPDLVRELLANLSDRETIAAADPAAVLAGISIVADLPEASRRPEMARNIVTRAVRNGFTASDMQKLPGAMDAARRSGQFPAVAILEGVSEQLQRDIPASRVLQNLFNGNVGGGPPGHTPPGLENRPGRGGPPNNSP